MSVVDVRPGTKQPLTSLCPHTVIVLQDAWRDISRNVLAQGHGWAVNNRGRCGGQPRTNLPFVAHKGWASKGKKQQHPFDGKGLPIITVLAEAILVSFLFGFSNMSQATNRRLHSRKKLASSTTVVWIKIKWKPGITHFRTKHFSHTTSFATFLFISYNPRILCDAKRFFHNVFTYKL